jgi:hypothetical protein
MPTILIASPDPETTQLATLAFELDGWDVEVEYRPVLVKAGTPAEVVLLDIPELERTAEATEMRKASGQGAKSIVILPRGMGSEKVRRSFGEADRFVRRPFEIMSIVRLARELASVSPAAARKSRAIPRRPAISQAAKAPKAAASRKAAARPKSSKAAAKKPSKKKRPKK